MNTLLLLAKGLAIQDQSAEIGLPHIEQALTRFDVQGSTALMALQARAMQRMDGHQNDGLDIEAVLDKAERADPMPISHEARALIRRLRSVADALRIQPRGHHSLPAPLRFARRVRDSLKEGLFGQDAAIARIAQHIGAGDDADAPVKGLFVFAGPSGCGKTHAAHLISHALSGYAFLSIDCSAMNSALNRSTLDGNPSYIAGSGPGMLTEHVHKYPKSVVLLENFDLMHPAAQNVIVPVLTTGMLTDQFGFYENNDKKDTRLGSACVSFKEVYFVIEIGASVASLYEAPAFVGRLLAEGGEQRLVDTLANTMKSATNETAHRPGPAFSAQVLPLLLSKACMCAFRALDFVALKALARQGLNLAAGRFDASMATATSILQDNRIATVLALARGGHVHARHLSAEVIGHDVFGRIAEHWMMGEGHHEHVVLDLADAQAQHTDAILQQLGDQPLQGLLRRQLRVVYEIAFESRNGVLHVFLANIALRKDAHAGDFQAGSGGILVDLPDIGFDAIAGQDHVKAALQRQVGLLAKRSAYRPPTGMLMYGPPGTGKTTLARAFAAQCQLPFIQVTGPQLLDLSFQRQVIARMMRYAPCILFIDELDGLGNRKQGINPAVSELLAGIDGVSSRAGEPVFVIGTTNTPSSIDPALLRPGRLELHLEVKDLDRSGRHHMLRAVAHRIHPDAMQALLDYSAGMSGAQMEAAIREIDLSAASQLSEHGARALLDQVVFGTPTALSAQLREAIAFHEAGHAVAHLAGGHARIEYVSLTSRDRSGGHILATRTVEHVLSQSAARANLTAVLAGRIAQIIRFGQEDGCDSGAASDLEKATALAHQCIARFGMDPVVKMVSMPEHKDSVFRMPGLERRIEKRVLVWLDEAQTTAHTLLTTHWNLVQAIALRLLDQGAIAHGELMEMARAHGLD